MARRALVIYNPAAKTTADPQMWMPQLSHELCEKSDFLLTLHALDLNQCVSQFIDPSLDLVIAAGGDGTIRCVLSAVANTAPNVPVAIYPLGTANALARNLRIVDEQLLANPLARAAEVISSGVPTPMDLGMANGEHFVVMAGVGPLSDVFFIPDEEQKAQFKVFAYIASAVKQVKAPPVVFDVEADGEKFRVEAAGIFLSNVEDFGLNRKTDPNCLGDGMLRLSVFAPKEFKDYLNIGFNIVGGGEPNDYYVRSVKEATVKTADSHTVDIQLDGDKFGGTPMHCKALPAAVKVIAPVEFAHLYRPTGLCA